jgi:ubiquinol-cytochrome c reductase cytochrome b subunit
VKALSWLRVASAALGLLCLLLLMVSGWALMAGYVPSDAEAFSSIVYLRQKTAGGAWTRSLHYHLAALAVVAGFVHLLSSYLSGRHADERRDWWAACGLYLLLLGICFTGYLLPMDQNAYWGTIVRLGIVETIPGAGPALAGLLRGGPAINAATLPRFHALHVAVLPTLALLPLLPLARRMKAYVAATGGWRRWLILGLVALALLYLVAALLPAPLETRADAADSEYVPRPEWYFRWLFQLGKYLEPVPWAQSLLVPLAGCALLAALPLLGPRRAVARFVVALGWCALWVALTALSYYEDRGLPAKPPYEEAMRLQAVAHYEKLCLECHGGGGRGDGPQSKIFDLDARDFTTAEIWLEVPAAEMKRAIRDGKGKDMPEFGKQLSPEEIDALLVHIRVTFAPAGL